MKHRAVLAVASLLIPLAGSACAQVPPCRKEGALIDAVRALHEKQANVGLSAAIVLNGELAFSHTMGFAELEHRVPVTARTRFGAASITKAVTAIAVLQLWSEGRLDLDAPVQRYVPSFPVRPEGAITVRMLATHRSGLPHPSERSPALFATHYETAMAAVDVFRDVPLVSVPGAARVYSSSNYNLLAAIVEAVPGAPFTQHVERSVLQPAGMQRTRFDDTRAIVVDRAARYTFYDPWTSAESAELLRVPTWDYSFNMGGGGLLSTAEDLALLGAQLLTPALLTADARRLFFSDDWFGRVSPTGERFVRITGSNPGVQASLVIYPSRSAAAALLANTWGRGSRSAEMVLLPGALVEACTGGGTL